MNTYNIVLYWREKGQQLFVLSQSRQFWLNHFQWKNIQNINFRIM